MGPLPPLVIFIMLNSCDFPASELSSSFKVIANKNANLIELKFLWVYSMNMGWYTQNAIFIVSHVWVYYTPRFNEVERGVYWFYLVRLSVCLSVCLSVDRIVSSLYLQQYSSDPFHICTSYQATSAGVSRVKFVSPFKNLKFWQILKICNFDFVFFWLGIQYAGIILCMRPANETL